MRCSSNDNIGFALRYEKVCSGREGKDGKEGKEGKEGEKNRMKIGARVKVDGRWMIALCDDGNRLSIYDPVTA